MTDSRIDGTQVNVVYGGTADKRLDGTQINVVAVPIPQARLDAIYAQSLLTALPPRRLDAVYAQTLVTTSPPPRRLDAIYAQTLIPSAPASPTTGTYSTEVLADAPIWYGRLGEPSGTTMNDSSGNARHGTYFNSPTLGVPGLVDGDTAVTFNGSNQYGIVTYASWMAVTNLTVEAIIKTTATGIVSILDRDGLTGNRAWQFRLNAGKLEFVTINGGAGVVTAADTGAAINDGHRHHVAATYDATDIRLYVDGNLVQTTAAVGALSTQTSDLRVAVNASVTIGSAWFPGTIDEAAMYGTVLTPLRIYTHSIAAANGLTALVKSDPAEWFKADAITGLVDNDPVSSWIDSANARNATQSTAGAKPTYKTNIQNALPVVRFDGGDYLSSTGSASGTKSVAAAFNVTNRDFRTIFGPNNTSAFQVRTSQSAHIELLSNGSSTIGASSTVCASQNEWHVVVVTYTSGSAWSINIDGLAAGSGSTATTLTAGRTITIGSARGAVEFFIGDIGEVAVWDRALTSTEITGISAELRTKWATARAQVNPTWTASSEFSVDWVATNLGDGRLGGGSVPTYSWSPTGSGQTGWVRAQLSSTAVVDRYRIAARTDTAAYCPASWTFEGSNDGSSWTTLDTRSSQSFSVGEFKIYDITNTATYTYYRLNITTTGNGLQPTFSELTLFAALTVAGPVSYWGIRM